MRGDILRSSNRAWVGSHAPTLADLPFAIVGCSRAFSSRGTPESTLTYIKFFGGAAVTLAGAVTRVPPEDSKSRRKRVSISSV